jgi:Spy/CpxP family protein refolding chaperone
MAKTSSLSVVFGTVLVLAAALLATSAQAGHMGGQGREHMMESGEGDCPQGYGMGMMGGMGSGMGMMGGGMGPMGMLDLSDEQREAMRGIQRDLAKKQRGLMVQMWDEQDKLVDLYAAETRDPAAIGKVYGKIFDLKRQMIEASIAAGNKMETVLTDEQREQLKTMRHRMGMGRGMGMGYGGMMGGMGPGMGMMGQ